ncbi:MAG: hypothetical protein ACLS90_07845 [Clostridia bacterium]
MKLDLINKMLRNIKDNKEVQDFIGELTKNLEKEVEQQNVNNNKMDLNQEGELYQVIEIGTDYAYLQNINTNKIEKEENISKEVLDKIVEDTVLQYKNGEYIIEEELTREIFR